MLLIQLRLPLIILIFCTLARNGAAQVITDLALFSGNYDKEFISTKKIEKIIIQRSYDKLSGGKGEYTFDKNGFLNHQVNFEDDGKLAASYRFVYNEQGDQVTRIEVNSAGKETTAEVKNEYKNGRLISTKDTASHLVTRYEYGDNGLPNRKITHLEIPGYSGNDIAIDIFYDGRQRVIREVEKILDPAGTLIENRYVANYFYNNKSGRLIKRVRKGASSEEYTYNQDRLLDAISTTLDLDDHKMS